MVVDVVMATTVTDNQIRMTVVLLLMLLLLLVLHPQVMLQHESTTVTFTPTNLKTDRNRA